MASDLLDFIAVAVATVFHPTAEVFGIGDLRRTDAAAHLLLGLATAALSGQNIDMAAGIEGELVLRHHGAAEDIDVTLIGVQQYLAAAG